MTAASTASVAPTATTAATATTGPSPTAEATKVSANNATIAQPTAALVIERHWGTPIRFIPWIALVALAWCVWRLWRGPTARELRAARVIAAASSAAAFVGIALHVNENYKAGPLDEHYSLIWESMSELERWWAALILVSLLVIVASQRHPALAR
jgi:hypothetical protein